VSRARGGLRLPVRTDGSVIRDLAGLQWLVGRRMKEGGWERREQAVAMVRKVCTFDEDEQIHCISREYLGLRTAETAEDSKGLEVIRRWDLGELKIGDPRSVPIESVDASMQ